MLPETKLSVKFDSVPVDLFSFNLSFAFAPSYELAAKEPSSFLQYTYYPLGAPKMIPLLAPRVVKSQKRAMSPGRATKSLEDDLCATAKTENGI